MSKIFEITHRDAAARIGKLVMENELSTPAIINIFDKDCPIVDSGSIWNRFLPVKANENKIIILPHKTLPLQTSEEIIKDFLVSTEYAKLEHTGLVIHPFTREYPVSELCVLGAAKQLENRARELVDSIIRLKENSRTDTLLYTPALATPENLAILLYLGVDMVDEVLPIIKGYQGIYLTNSGEFHLDRLHEFPCSCQICLANTPDDLLKMPVKERSGLLAEHNSFKLGEELRTVRERIRSGNLREYVEYQCRVRPWLTAALRLMDMQYDFLEKRTPIIRSNTLYANTSESQNRVEIQRFSQRVQERYTAPELDTLVLFPCSARKPYSISLTHQKFINALGRYRKFVHEVIITSPMGVVPRELELLYPAAHYDTPVTGHWDLEERAWVGRCLHLYLQKNKYKNVIAHVYGAYREICESVANELDMEFIYTADTGVTSRESLKNLEDAVSGFENSKKRSAEEGKLDMMRATADYQFGKGAGDNLVTENAIIRAPFPKFQLFVGKQQLATLIPQYGTLALTINGGRRLVDHPDYRIKIADFIPHSSILAPGVLDADPQIRPNDEVIVEGERFFGVGRAFMSGWEMKECKKGIAVELRHSMKLHPQAVNDWK